MGVEHCLVCPSKGEIFYLGKGPWLSVFSGQLELVESKHLPLLKAAFAERYGSNDDEATKLFDRIRDWAERSKIYLISDHSPHFDNLQGRRLQLVRDRYVDDPETDNKLSALANRRRQLESEMGELRESKRYNTTFIV